MKLIQKLFGSLLDATKTSQAAAPAAALGAAALPLFEILTPKLETSPSEQQVA